jgi:predicted metal-dependent phosphoesterase TrpH
VYRAEFPCDLHTHTKRSDGNDTPRELIDCAADAGVRILALTDHDITAPETIDVDGEPVGLLEYGRRRNVGVIPSIEFSCDTIVEDVHILALGCDFSHPFFEREYRDSVRSKIDGYRELTELLTEDGLPVDWQRDILLDGQRGEETVQRKFIFEVMAQRGYVKEWSDAKLLVKNTPKYSVKRRKPDPIGIIRDIHEAGGAAILAHPYLIAEKAEWHGEPVSRAEYLERLLDAGLDGMEMCYPYGKTSYAGSIPADEVDTEVRRLYGDRVRIMSGGSDYHDEGRKGSKNPRRLGEKGVTLEYFEGNPLLSGLL